MYSRSRLDLRRMGHGADNVWEALEKLLCPKHFCMHGMCIHIPCMYEGRSINKLQNDIILLIFKI